LDTTDKILILINLAQFLLTLIKDCFLLTIIKFE
jgi:hypothetical protein